MVLVMDMKELKPTVTKQLVLVYSEMHGISQKEAHKKAFSFIRHQISYGY